MIKNNKQLVGARKRIKKIKSDLLRLSESNYEKAEIEALSGYLNIELKRLEAQVEEYEGLVRETLNESVHGRLRKPVLLDEIGELLAKLRIAAGLTQKDLADMLGWKQSNVSRFESEDYQSQTIAKVAEYADGLGVWLYVVPELEELNKEIHYKKSDDTGITPLSKKTKFESSTSLNVLNPKLLSEIFRPLIDRLQEMGLRENLIDDEKSTVWSTDAGVFKEHINSMDLSDFGLSRPTPDYIRRSRVKIQVMTNVAEMSSASDSSSID